ncbi:MULTISPECIES: hypothetical protein [unclassified Bradyrhizobium]|uniref:hypothetical protein n=1 Tax=unclassified Bradyrhizobium TaxID=2631580 RepID=UPI0028EBB291|nr:MULTISPECIES: hypothetical protein [unclassified Bradyrhizobium]
MFFATFLRFALDMLQFHDCGATGMLPQTSNLIAGVTVRCTFLVVLLASRIGLGIEFDGGQHGTIDGVRSTGAVQGDNSEYQKYC